MSGLAASSLRGEQVGALEPGGAAPGRWLSHALLVAWLLVQAEGWHSLLKPLEDNDQDVFFVSLEPTRMPSSQKGSTEHSLLKIPIVSNEYANAMSIQRVYLCTIFLLTLVPFANDVLFISEFRKAEFRVLSNLNFIICLALPNPNLQ